MRMKSLVLLTLISLTVMAQETQPIIIAHRGASGYLPEHTLEAKAMAHAMGAHFIEQDVVLSRDDVPVVLHDIHLDSISDVAALDEALESQIYRMLRAELQNATIVSIGHRSTLIELHDRRIHMKVREDGAFSPAAMEPQAAK